MTPQDFAPVKNVIDATFKNINISLFKTVIVISKLEEIKTLISFALLDRAIKAYSDRLDKATLSIVANEASFNAVKFIENTLSVSSEDDVYPNTYVKLFPLSMEPYIDLVDKGYVQPSDFAYYSIGSSGKSQSQLEYIVNEGSTVFSIVELPSILAKLELDELSSVQKYAGSLSFKINTPTLIVIPRIDKENMFLIETLALHGD